MKPSRYKRQLALRGLYPTDDIHWRLISLGMNLVGGERHDGYRQPSRMELRQDCYEKCSRSRVLSTVFPAPFLAQLVMVLPAGLNRSRYSDGKVETTVAYNATMPPGHLVPVQLRVVRLELHAHRPGRFLYTARYDDYLTFGWWLDEGCGRHAAVLLPGLRHGYGYGKECGMQTEPGDRCTVTADRKTVVLVGRTGGAIAGSATYKGAAAGKYTILGPAKITATYEGGHFTARCHPDGGFRCSH